eukprot:71157_1
MEKISVDKLKNCEIDANNNDRNVNNDIKLNKQSSIQVENCNLVEVSLDSSASTSNSLLYGSKSPIPTKRNASEIPSDTEDTVREKLAKYTEFKSMNPQLIRPMSLFLDDEYSKIENSVTLSWKNITYTTASQNNKQSSKRLLHNIGGYVQPGKVLCILSPNKTDRIMLLEILSGLRHASDGHIYYDGILKVNDANTSDIMGYKKNAIYISKDDIMVESMTVYESLRFAAQLKTFTSEDIHTHELVRNMIELLDLIAVTDDRISSLSIGDKRKVLIGAEIINQPSLLFMEEIISDLDSKCMTEVMNIVDILCKKGHTIVMSIDRPSSAIYEMMCENEYNISLLSHGKAMYFGNTSNIVDYFEDNG